MTNEKEMCALSFGALLVERREQKGLHQWEVAEMLGISQPYYCYLEKGQRAIDLVLAIEASRILGIDLNEFACSYKQ